MFTISTIIVAVVVRAWVFTLLWSWFVVPLGAPEVGIATAVGLALIISLFTQHLAKEETKDKSMINDLITRAFLAPIVTLIVGWLVTYFV